MQLCSHIILNTLLPTRAKCQAPKKAFLVCALASPPLLLLFVVLAGTSTSAAAPSASLAHSSFVVTGATGADDSTSCEHNRSAWVQQGAAQHYLAVAFHVP